MHYTIRLDTRINILLHVVHKDLHSVLHMYHQHIQVPRLHLHILYMYLQKLLHKHLHVLIRNYIHYIYIYIYAVVRNIFTVHTYWLAMLLHIHYQDLDVLYMHLQRTYYICAYLHAMTFIASAFICVLSAFTIYMWYTYNIHAITCITNKFTHIIYLCI